MLKIISVGRQNDKHNFFCNKSVDTQTNTNWQHIQMCDHAPVEKTVESGNRITVWQTGCFGSLSNIVEGIKRAKPHPEDIICLLDGDDQFNRNDALDIVQTRYDKNPKLLLTYGSYVCSSDSGNIGRFCGRYEEHEDIRTAPWRASHLKTFKFKLWKRLYGAGNRRLRDATQKYFMFAGDVAIMMPLYELAGYDRTDYIELPIYRYNDENPMNEHKVDRATQKNTEMYIRSQKKLDRAEDL